MNGQQTEYKVMAGKLILGRTADYNEAVSWVRQHDGMKSPGAPYARIVEVR